MNESEGAKSAATEAEAELIPAQPSGDLYDEELTRYRQALNRGVEHAYRRYGFVLYHSLDGTEVVDLRKKMGFAPVEATDFYNFGVVSAEKDELPEAIECFQRAMKAEPELADAEFNLALALEKSGDKAAAKKQWASYLKREALSEADRQAASQHLKELD